MGPTVIELRRRPEPLPRVMGWVVLGVFAVFVAGGAFRRLDEAPAAAAIGSAAAILLAAATVLGPPRTVLASAVAASAALAVVGGGTASNVAFFGICVLAAWCAVAASALETGIYFVGAMLLFAVEWRFGETDPGWAAWIGGTAFSVVGCWFGRRQRELADRLRVAQAGLADRARAEERNRIARELHDVIAHSLTVSLLHVASARLALDDEDRVDAARALAEAERLGRQSLDEVRHAVGLLRVDGADPTGPLPGSVDVPALLERFRSAGADVRADVQGDLAGLPATVGLATYRILQEALTNAVKHAPGAAATVHLAVAADAVRLAVDSAGAPGRGSGLGLIGMQERAAALGGRCTAAPGGSGWLVRAELPLVAPA
jgi:signal transduction histidine kinase